MKKAFFRKCVSCGKKEHKSNFLKIRAENLEIDLFQNKSGRSFYVCLDKSCIKKVLRKKSVTERVLDVYKNRLDYGYLREDIKNSLINLLEYSYNGGLPVEKCNDFSRHDLVLLNNMDMENILQGIDILRTDYLLLDGSKKACVVRDLKLSRIIAGLRPFVLNFDGLL